MCNSNAETVKAALGDILTTLLDRSVDEQEFSRPYRELGIDSLQMVALYCELEETLMMDLKLEEMDLSSLTTPNHTVDYVCQRMLPNED